MANLFSPSSDLVLRIGLLLVVGTAMALTAALLIWGNPRLASGQPVHLAQPVMFSHEQHAGLLGLDCRYCHSSVEDSAFAGMPTAETCMHCHKQLYTQSKILEPVREAWRTGDPIAWRRVHDLPDFAHFDHRVHVSAGVACVSCHGDVTGMPLMRRVQPLTMGWCLDCHRHPGRELVPEHQVFSPSARPGSSAVAFSPERASTLTNCSACHY